MPKGAREQNLSCPIEITDGGQGKDGHDRIHMAESYDNGIQWEKLGAVIQNGSANHVNDPTVVRAQDLWWMFYTVAETAENDQIALATSDKGMVWKQLGVVVQVGGENDWDAFKVGRPSALFENGKFRLWHNVQTTEAATQNNDLAEQVRKSGRVLAYAESNDGIHWTRHPKPVLFGPGAVHVTIINQSLIMTWESHQGIYWAISNNGIEWEKRGLLTGLSGEEFDQFGQVTPFLDVKISEISQVLATNE